MHSLEIKNTALF